MELVTDYLEGALEPDERARFEEHVAPCDGCTNYVEQMRRTLELLGRLPHEAITPEAEQALLAAFRGWKTEGGSA